MAKFMSKCSNQILSMVPTRIISNNGITETVQGKRIVFANGEYETKDKKEIDFLKNHILFGFRIVEAEDKKVEVTEKTGE